MANGIENYQGGGATVLNGFYGGIMNALYRGQEIAMKKQAAEEKRQASIVQDLQNQIGKINPNGLRTADIDDYANRYQEIKDLYFKASRFDSEVDRIKAEANLKQKINELELFVNQSKQTGTAALNLASQIGANPFAYGEEAASRFKQYMDTPTSKLNADTFSPLNWQKTPDPDRINKLLNDTASDLLRNAESDTVVEAGTLGKKQGDWYWSEKSVPEEAYTTALLQKYQSDGEFRAFVAQQYPELAPEEALVDIARTKIAEGRLTQVNDRKFSAAPRPRASDRDGSASGTAGVGDPVFGLPINYRDSRVESDVYVPISVSKIQAPGTPALSMATGQVTQLPAEAEVSLVGLARLPQFNSQLPSARDGEYAYIKIERDNPDTIGASVGIAPKTLTEYAIIPAQSLPSNLPNNKVVTAARQRFEAAADARRAASGQQQIPTNQNNSVSLQPTGGTQVRRGAADDL